MGKKSKIFIASSPRASQLATAIKNKLDTEYSEATIWSETKKGTQGGPEKLIQAAEEDFDYAVILLTERDLQAGGSQELLEETYNCISEAGLFMGILGGERCFLISNISHQDVPSDLRSMNFWQLPKDHSDSDSSLKVIDYILEIIKEKDNFTKRLRLDYVSFKDLLDRQKLKNDGGELIEGCQVIYLMNQPFFGNPKQFRKNMPQVSYYYFLPAEGTFITERMADFLQRLLGADIIKEECYPCFIELRESLAEEKYQRTMLEALKEIVDNNRLKICFFPVAATFQFVIHNIGTADAKTYINFDDQGFLEWMKDREVNLFADSILSCLTQPRKNGIFHATQYFNIDDDTVEQSRLFKASIERELKRYFPGIHEQVAQLCFEGKLD